MGSRARALVVKNRLVSTCSRLLFIFSCWTPTSPTSLPFILGVTCQAWLVMVATIVVLYVPLMQASPCLMLKPRWWHPSPLDDWRRTRIRSPCTSAFGQRDCMKLYFYFFFWGGEGRIKEAANGKICKFEGFPLQNALFRLVI